MLSISGIRLIYDFILRKKDLAISAPYFPLSGAGDAFSRLNVKVTHLDGFNEYLPYCLPSNLFCFLTKECFEFLKSQINTHLWQIIKIFNF